MNLHKEHGEGSGHVDCGSGAPQAICETCSHPARGRMRLWDQIHRDWEALRDYIDRIEPELVELRKLRDATPVAQGGQGGTGPLIANWIAAIQGETPEYDRYRAEFPNDDPRQ